MTGRFSWWARCGPRQIGLILLFILALTLAALSLHGAYRARNIEANTRQLNRLGLALRVFPHRVNSGQEARRLFERGVRSFELDVRFDARTNTFGVGHDRGERSGDLAGYLEAVPAARLGRLWLDVKNLSRKNCTAALGRLEVLDAELSIKARAIVESASKTACLGRFARLGWHTSYYLPTDRCLSLLGRNDSEGLASLAAGLQAHVLRQKISAVSFDRRLYPFVKEHLEPILGSSVQYHLWDTSIDYFAADMIDQLRTREYFRDGRVKTVILPQVSLLQRLGQKQKRVARWMARP